MRFRFAGLWRHPDFLRLWAGQTVSELGSRITRDGLPLAAVMALGATPAQMGLLTALGGIPYLLAGLFAGVWVDRLRRRPILIAADVGRALVLALIPLAAVLGALQIELLFVVTVLAGLLTVFFQMAYFAYLPSLVDRDNLLEGNTKMGLSGSLAEVLGPGIAGVLIQWLSAPVAILIDSASFLVSAASLALIRKPEPSPKRAAPRGHAPGVRQEMAEGLRATLAHPLLRAVTFCSATLAFFGGFFGTLYALYAIRELGLGPAGLGLTIAAGGVGDLLGTLLITGVVARWGLGRALIGSVLVRGLFAFLIPLAGGPVAISMGLLVFCQLGGDLASAIYNINEVSLRQAVAPDRLLGRVNASFGLVVESSNPVGAMVGGALATVMGVRPALAVAAAGITLACLWLVWSPIRALKVHPAVLASGSGMDAVLTANSE